MAKDTAPQTYRAASKGAIFTRTEKVNMILNKKANDSFRNSMRAELAEERKKINQEKEKRKQIAAARKFLIVNPDVKKLNRKKDGTFFHTPRVNGKFAPAVIVG